MKRLLYISIILMVAACKREPLTSYDIKDNIYFNNQVTQGNYVDSTDFTFAYSDESVKDSMISIPLAITGAPAATDRHFSVVIDTVSTAQVGVQFEMQDLVFHANKVKDTMQLKLIRTPDLTTGAKKIVLRLQPNSDFETKLVYNITGTSVLDTTNLLTFTISTADILTAGPAWDNTYSRFFGTFSLKKMQLVHDITGMPLNFWSTPTLTSTQSAQAVYYATTTGRYLNQQASEGNTILDEDGTAMAMGAGFQ